MVISFLELNKKVAALYTQRRLRMYTDSIFILSISIFVIFFPLYSLSYIASGDFFFIHPDEVHHLHRKASMN